MRPAQPLLNLLALAAVVSPASAQQFLPCGGCEAGHGFVECSPAGEPVCTQCAVGQASLGGYNRCLPCGGCGAGFGFVSCSPIALGDPACEPCPQNSYGEGGSSACQPCPNGSTSPAAARSLQECQCPQGSVPAPSACVPCPPGAFYSFMSAPACQACPPNAYCAGGLAGPAPCPPGTLCPAQGSSAPAPCPPGSYCAGGGAVEPCPAGAYCPEGATAPVPCPPGTWGAQAGRSTRAGACNRTCSACQPGYFLDACLGPSPGMCLPCSTCQGGMYQTGCHGNSTGDDSACAPCPPGSVSRPGARACAACPPLSEPAGNGTDCLCRPGLYLNPGGACAACPGCEMGAYRAGCGGASQGLCVPCAPCPDSHLFDGCYGEGVLQDNGRCSPCQAGYRNSGGYAYLCRLCPPCPRFAYRPGCNNTTPPLPCLPCRGCPAGRVFAGCNGSGFRDDGDCAQECPPGLHNAGGHATNCTPCPSAQGPATPVSECACDPGTHGPTGWDCAPCPAGAFCAGGGAAPQLCPAGTWGSLPGQADRASACPNDCATDATCPPGAYPTPLGCGGDAGPQCVPCPPGTRQNATGGVFCAPCPPGLHAYNASSGECAPCPAGLQACYGDLACPSGSIARRNYSRGERATWVVRPSAPSGLLRLAVTSSDAAGRVFRSNSGLDTLSVYTCLEAATACLAQVFTGHLGASGRLPLPLGWLATDTGLFVLQWASRASGLGLGWEVSWVSDGPPCLPCGPGQISLNAGSECVKCIAGTFSANASSSSCTLCHPGTFQTGQGAGACQACLPGWYQPFPGSTGCLACAPGQYSTSSGASNGEACSLCTAGTYQPYDGHSACIACTGGQYQPSRGETGCLACTPCPANSTQLQPCSGIANNAQCLCPNQFYFTPWTCTRCQTCPAGTYLVDCNGTNPGSCQPCRQCPPTSYLPGCGGTSPGTACTPCGIIQCVLGTYLAGCGNISAGACKPCGLACPPGHYTADCGFQSQGWCAQLS